MKHINNSTPVLVLSPHHHGALGVFRSLGTLGIPVYALEDGRWAPPLRSRFCRGVFHWDVRHAPPRDSVASLLAIARKFQRRPILIPTDDATTVLVQEAAEQLRNAYLFPVLPAGLVHRLTSKKELYCLSREQGVPTPEAFFFRSRSELLQVLDKVQFPLMLKGVEDRLFFGQTKVSMRIVRTADELLNTYDEIEDSAQPNLMLQEYIPGDADSVWMFNGYFDQHSDCLAGFTGRKLRQRPAYTGITSLGICLQNDAVHRSICVLLRSQGYRGMVDVGFRYDQRDGQYKLLDINPRLGCTFRLFVDPAGMDVVRACYLDLTGQPVHAQPARQGRKWIVENQDLMTLPQLFKDRRLTVGQWLCSLWGVRETAWFYWCDFFPLWTLWTGLLRSLRLRWFRNRKSRRLPVRPLSGISRNPQFKPEGDS
jgi:D-aspartate ligase